MDSDIPKRVLEFRGVVSLFDLTLVFPGLGPESVGLMRNDDVVYFGIESPSEPILLSLREIIDSANQDFPDYGHKELFFTFGVDVETNNLIWRLLSKEGRVGVNDDLFAGVYH